MNIKSFKKKFKLRRVCIWSFLIILFMTFKISTHISKHPFTMFNSNKTTLDSIQICLVTGTLLVNFIEQLSIHEFSTLLNTEMKNCNYSIICRGPQTGRGMNNNHNPLRWNIILFALHTSQEALTLISKTNPKALQTSHFNFKFKEN